jgi:hypothetical protein
VLVWSLELPGSPIETSAWLEKMTNAVVGTGARSLEWR